MDITIYPTVLSGTVRAIPSKSQAHRLLICAAFADRETELLCPETNKDIEATVACLRALGADIQRTDEGYLVKPIHSLPQAAVLNCAESGSTLRFLLPVVGALGVDGTFQMEGRLPQRPLSPLWEEMERMGCTLSRPTTTGTLRCTGKLKPGNYSISGSVSSQYITGLLFAMAIMPGESNLVLTDKLESKPYVDMTQAALSTFGVNTDNFHVCGHLPFRSPGKILVEGDWSNGAFFLAAASLGSQVQTENLDPNSPQGDKEVSKLLAKLQQHTTISAAHIPDLIPILSVVAAAKNGAVFTDIQRLRLKESDRVATVCQMLGSLGIRTQSDESTLTVFPGKLHGGTVDSFNDHRIAMSAAIAATVADGPVAILGAQCVEKSYPRFWQEYRNLGGKYEQYLR